MKIRINTNRENKWIILGIWLLVCIGAKVIQLYFLPAKYSYDGRRIFSEAASGYRSGDKGYDTAADFFSFLNKIFPAGSYEEWAVLLGIAGSILLILFIKDSLKSLYLTDFIFLSCSLFLTNVYTFNVSKEIVQMLFFLPAIYVLCCQCKEKTKIAVVVICLLGIALFLRIYFALIAVIFCLIYRCFWQYHVQKKRKFLKKILLFFLLGIAGLFFLQNYMPEIFDKILYARAGINQYRMGSQDAQTMIVDIFDNDGSIELYILNLVVNLFRLMFPFSLLKDGIFQILFLVYQVIMSVRLFLAFYRQPQDSMDGNSFIAASLLIAYFIVAAIFEPDYGSVIRHEMTLFPVMYIALLKKKTEL